MKAVEKKREIKVNQKSRGLKEIYIGGGIDPHDLGIKLRKVKEFLASGHPVKIAVTALKKALKNNPFCVEETTIKVLEEVEDSVASVQQGVSSNTRKLFTLSPKQIIPASDSST
jgi:translation initiation factor IF-3